jgi:hypothetical protein
MGILSDKATERYGLETGAMIEAMPMPKLLNSTTRAIRHIDDGIKLPKLAREECCALYIVGGRMVI